MLRAGGGLKKKVKRQDQRRGEGQTEELSGKNVIISHTSTYLPDQMKRHLRAG